MRRLPITFVFMLVYPITAMAAPSSDPEWPCIQRKVPVISTAQMWSGPEITDEIREIGRQQHISELASRLAHRRTSLEEAENLIARFASQFGETRNKMLTALFARTFDLIANERTAVMAGIGRYAKKQAALSEKIEKRRKELAELNSKEPPDYDRIEELQDYLAWDERIFRERSQSLTYVCEAPVILEKKIFSIAHAIQSHLTQ